MNGKAHLEVRFYCLDDNIYHTYQTVKRSVNFELFGTLDPYPMTWTGCP